MGNAAGTLSNEQRAEVVKYVRERYDRFQDLPADEQSAKVLECYREILSKQHAANESRTSTTNQESDNEDLKKKKVKIKSKKMRRRSFDRHGSLAYSTSAAAIRTQRAMEKARNNPNIRAAGKSSSTPPSKANHDNSVPEPVKEADIEEGWLTTPFLSFL